MEQPELGKKILELRKANGLTQEELVARCNINVRTIQRIEAGEVTPRGHTIRSIFAALDIDIEQWQKKTTVPKGSKKAAQWIFLAFLSGLLYFLLAFCIAADLYLFYLDDTNAMAVMAGESIVFGSIYLVFGYGLVKYQKEFGNMALVAGIVAILTGLAFISVVLALPGLILLAVSEALALVVLYRAFDKVRNQKF